MKAKLSRSSYSNIYDLHLRASFYHHQWRCDNPQVLKPGSILNIQKRKLKMFFWLNMSSYFKHLKVLLEFLKIT